MWEFWHYQYHSSCKISLNCHCTLHYCSHFSYCCPMYPATFCWIYYWCSSVAHVSKDNVYIFACIWWMLNLLQSVPEKHGSCSGAEYFVVSFASSYNIFETVIIHHFLKWCFVIWDSLICVPLLPLSMQKSFKSHSIAIRGVNAAWQMLTSNTAVWLINSIALYQFSCMHSAYNICCHSCGLWVLFGWNTSTVCVQCTFVPIEFL